MHLATWADENPKAPAQHVLEPEIKRFHFGFGKDKSEYQGEPSDELDARWKKLYHSESLLLPLPIPHPNRSTHS